MDDRRRRLLTEILKRRAARASFLAFCQFMDKDFRQWDATPPKHIIQIIEKFEQLERGEINRLMIFSCPRSWKTRVIGQLGSLWFMLRNSPAQIIHAGYGHSLSCETSRLSKRYATSTEYSALSGGLKPVGTSQGWSIADRRSFFATTIGGSAVGRGFDLGEVDDPFKTRQEADSPTQRERVWDWWRGVFLTRAEKDAKIIITNTRWGVDDLAGRILSLTPDRWDVLSIPAITPEGNSFWPERFPMAELEKIHKSIGSREWESQYMQSPVNREGGLFKREWFRFTTGEEKLTRLIRYWDTAGTVNGDYTVGCLLAETADGEFVVKDIARMRGTPEQVNRYITDTAKSDGYGVPIIREQVGIGGLEVMAYMRQMLPSFAVYGDVPRSSKESRAIMPSSRVEAGLVKLERARWNDEFLDELVAFPTAPHDDQVDAFTGALRWMSAHRASVINPQSGCDYAVQGSEEYEYR